MLVTTLRACLLIVLILAVAALARHRHHPPPVVAVPVVESRVFPAEITRSFDRYAVAEVTSTVPSVPPTTIRVAPRPRPASGHSHAPPASAAAGASVAGDVWARLAQCESGGNPRTNTGNGFFGMYQFTLATWRSVGGAGLPSDASAGEQTDRAKALQARSGWGQWPACSRKLGLR